MRTVWAICVLGLLAAGCTPKIAKPKIPEYQGEVGETHVSVLSVMPFAELQDKLLPKFDVKSADDLKDEAMPDTASEEMQLLRALIGKLSVEATDMPRGNPLASKKEAVETTAPKAEATLRKPMEMDKLKGDPFVRRSVQNALFQEIQMLNEQLRHVAARKGMVPYVVRVQVSLMPRRRNLPLDTYVTMTLLPRGRCVPPGLPDKAGCGDSPGTPGEGVVMEKGGEALPNPVVVPLLVTENLEALAYDRSSQELREFGLAILALFENLTGKAGGTFKTEDLRRFLGREMNSLLTVGSLTDNSLRVRLGAVRNSKLYKDDERAEYSYSMVPRTHVISFLLLAPEKKEGDAIREGEGDIALLSKTQFEGPGGGVDQPKPRTPQQVLHTLFKTMSPYFGPFTDSDYQALAAIIEEKELDAAIKHYQVSVEYALLENRYDQFRSWAKHLMCHFGKLKEEYPAEKDGGAAVNAPSLQQKKAVLDKITSLDRLLDSILPRLWLDMVEQYIGAQYHATQLSLPEGVGKAQLPDETFEAVAFCPQEDGNPAKTCTLLLANGKNLQSEPFTAWLRHGAVSLPSESATIMGGGTAIRAVFSRYPGVSVKNAKLEIRTNSKTRTYGISEIDHQPPGVQPKKPNAEHFQAGSVVAVMDEKGNATLEMVNDVPGDLARQYAFYWRPCGVSAEKSPDRKQGGWLELSGSRAELRVINAVDKQVVQIEVGFADRGGTDVVPVGSYRFVALKPGGSK